MKILITGKGSYIGSKTKELLKKNGYNVEELDMRDEHWKNCDFSKYKTIIHVAGIAHVSSDPKMEKMYNKVNRDLAIETAQKAKSEGTEQFIFMSSMIIFGKDGKIGEEKIITEKTKPNPIDCYGKSKLEADLEIQKMGDHQFKTVIVRSPMVYGSGCKGNFPKLKKIARICPIFPNIDNSRSMIYIDNLCEFFKQAIERQYHGVFYPQNNEYFSTKEIVRILAEEQGKKMHFTSIFNTIIKAIGKKSNYINKVFGNKTYSKELTKNFDYVVVKNEDSIRRSIR